MDDSNSHFQDRRSMEGTMQYVPSELAYPEGPLVQSDDAVDQGHAVSNSAPLPSPIADQDQESNTAGDNIIDEVDRAVYQLRDDLLDPEMLSDSSGYQPTGSIPTPVRFPIVPNYIADNNTTGQPGVFDPFANGFRAGTIPMGNSGYFHSTGFPNAASINAPIHNVPMANMDTARTDTASSSMNAISTDTALVDAASLNAAPLNAAPVNTRPANTSPVNITPVNVAPSNAGPVNTDPVNAAPANGPVAVTYQGHPIYSRRRRNRIGTRGCHVGSNGIDRPRIPEPLPIPGPPAGAPPGVTYPLSRMSYRPPGAPFYTSSGQKRFPCNRCGLVRSREDETRFHLRDVHYRQEYKWIHYGNHEQGLYYFGIDQSNIDCPNI
ncbi:hypothetical protein GCG54_00010654 [Colletotrichum gloeosporioides]|uniref:C2H2-type domain-containing protein n=1 Tax=Colletotrichum gloeosporioides TaxID=474922 RepID=A0A8H4FEM8_COLGL|nr:uncharacterized protein GCG54_00010654 [Colletotrichum gloeosporioides]KAF3798981.1 hypothetical protein GCG54_00010654 [Colletotrichum gloeosporioides]